ncbi:hypothetical protein F5Y18DRAFT_432483 [Xylariaceae sp. FL1019]|nr:hypothetical protein F5Y18DRAFT_432483 [Xylariaceae sp. FL1019]
MSIIASTDETLALAVLAQGVAALTRLGDDATSTILAVETALTTLAEKATPITTTEKTTVPITLAKGAGVLTTLAAKATTLTNRADSTISTTKLNPTAEVLCPMATQAPSPTPSPRLKPSAPVTGLTYGEAEVVSASATDNLTREERVQALKNFFCDDKQRINSDLVEFRWEAKARGYKTLSDSR